MTRSRVKIMLITEVGCELLVSSDRKLNFCVVATGVLECCKTVPELVEGPARFKKYFYVFVYDFIVENSKHFMVRTL